MSPSRGLRFIHLPRHVTSIRNYSTTPAPKSPIELLRLSPHRLHIYRSNSTNPFFNLSAEDYLLRHSPASSTLLFTYTNTPSIIIGRNQNIWSEVNVPLLNTPEYNSTVQLVRRRSGGGTVYHDLGNLCWSVIMPRKSFDRDFYANVVVKALHSMEVNTAMVNDRHDIILRRLTTSPDTGKVRMRDKKVSGSAYKIIRERAYHHATLLLNSDLANISALLRSPLKEFITTKGVESVRSPVENIGVEKEELVEKIEEEFLKANEWKEGEEEVVRVTLEEEETLKARDYIREGMMELQSQKWLYSQTPEFTLSLPPGKPLPELPSLPGFQPVLPTTSKLTLLSTTSTLQNIQISSSPDPSFSFVQSQESHIRLLNTPFNGPQINQKLQEINSLPDDFKQDVGRWLEHAIGGWGGEENVDLWSDGKGGKSLRLRAAEKKEEERRRRIKESKAADSGNTEEPSSP
ncbi:Biotin/lipoate A/B protein ligase, variant 2 [Arthrobotrys conoides]|uniref:Putative lipoate-protein ligase A n=1 Tax=Arthrobotrys conoides TaxID=74498 RepID=A0AAN8P3U2_9PEZI